ncbi:hypothetical protein GCM10007148_22240 [Parvularcula lutaonensis]|nr:hypothetical protein GCM10007148_22240 [Parvularcula lutaonensis]
MNRVVRLGLYILVATPAAIFAWLWNGLGCHPVEPDRVGMIIVSVAFYGIPISFISGLIVTALFALRPLVSWLALADLGLLLPLALAVAGQVRLGCLLG